MIPLRAVIDNIINEADGIKRFHLRLERPIHPVPGQYVMLYYRESPTERRAFSIVDHFPERNEIVLIIKLNGSMTSRLFEERVGSEIGVLGPYGRFVLPESDGDIVLIAGGIGITPLAAMLRQYLESERKGKVFLFYSAKRRSEMALIDELERISDPRFEMLVFLTEEISENAYNTRIDIDSVLCRLRDPESATFMICGPEGLIDSMRSGLSQVGISEDRIRSEAFT